MSLPVVFLSGADADLQEIFNRFEDYREGFGVEFMMAVDAYLTRIAIFPESAPAYSESVRRQVMQGFPYGTFYEPHPTGSLSRRFSICGRRPRTSSADCVSRFTRYEAKICWSGSSVARDA